MSRYKFKNRKFPKDFKKVSEYIQKTKGVTVILGHHTMFDGHFSRQISIHHNYDLTNRGLYKLLHECGKVFQTPEVDTLSKYQKFEREMEAWNGGLKLSKELGIDIDIDNYKVEQFNALVDFFENNH